MDKLKEIEQEYKCKDFPQFDVGDTIKVLTKIPEGDKVRLHPFEGLVISKKGTGLKTIFTVRKVSYGEGVERIFPLFSPALEKIEVVRKGKVKKAKLYYIREKIGKRATKIEAAEE